MMDYEILENGDYVADLPLLVDCLLHDVSIDGMKVLRSDEVVRYSGVLDIFDDVNEIPVDPLVMKWLDNDVEDLYDILSREIVIRQLDSEQYMDRLQNELEQCSEDMLETFIHVAMAVKKMGEVVTIGFGRGSSCASLILFLLGVHRVDPVKYDIPMSDFYKD